MATKAIRFSAALAGVFALGGLVSSAQAQFRPYVPPVSYNYLYNVGPTANQAAPIYSAGTAALSTVAAGAVGGYETDYTDPYMPNPSVAGGYLQGQASVVAATGKFMLNTQRARLIQEEANRSQIDTRRRIWEEAKWERMNTIFTEDYREQMIKTEQRRVRF